MTEAVNGGPLSGIRVLEFGSLGPTPFCGMLLSDLGADVVRIDRPTAPPASPYAIIERGRRSVVIDLKMEAGIQACLKMMGRADALIEGYRPGVMERLGLGPDVALAREPKLVYGRMTGWGQIGPYAGMAGHDVNYVALTGALHLIGPRERPMMPLDLVGDYGGGGIYLAFGVMCGLWRARETGVGQVVDAAMVDGISSLMSATYGGLAAGRVVDERENNAATGAAHYMGVYACADGKFISLAAHEPQFYRLLLDKLGLAGDPEFATQDDRDRWPTLKAKMAAVIVRRTRAEWCAVFEGTDACFSPVLSLAEAPQHPQMAARRTFIEFAGVLQPAPAPRFSRTPGSIKGPPPQPGRDNVSVLREWGFSETDIELLSAQGVLGRS